VGTQLNLPNRELCITMQTEYLDISGKKGGGPASLEARAKAEAVIAAALGAAKLEPPPVEKEVAAVPAAAPVDTTGKTDQTSHTCSCKHGVSTHVVSQKLLLIPFHTSEAHTVSEAHA
jgi:hypothetical protein